MKTVSDMHATLPEALQLASRRTAEIDPVFGSNLKEIDAWRNADFQGGNQLPPQPQSSPGNTGKTHQVGTTSSLHHGGPRSLR